MSVVPASGHGTVDVNRCPGPGIHAYTLVQVGAVLPHVADDHHDVVVSGVLDGEPLVESLHSFDKLRLTVVLVKHPFIHFHGLSCRLLPAPFQDFLWHSDCPRFHSIASFLFYVWLHYKHC